MTTAALDTSPAVSAAPVKGVLVRAKAALVDRRRADVDLIVAAVEWAHAHPAPNAQEVAGWGDGIMYGEGFLPLAGEGAPMVAEFAPFDLAAAIGWTTDATRALMGDGLELVHRLPGLWALVCELKVSAATARYAAEQTRDLAFEAAAHADRLLTRAIGVGLLSSRRIRALVDEARLYHDPDGAIGVEHHALAARRVELTPGNTPATIEIAMVLDSGDAEAFDKTVSQVAAQLGRLGDQDSLDIRRARAVGILADPRAALDLFTEGETTRRTPAKPSTPYLHLDQSALLGVDTFPAAVRSEGLRQGLVGLSGSGTVTVPQRCASAVFSAHDALAPLTGSREGVAWHVCRRGGRVAAHRPPHSAADARPPVPRDSIPWPRNEESTLNLAPLCRGHHRAKTFGRWHYQHLSDGSYRWTSPSGQIHLVPARPRD